MHEKGIGAKQDIKQAIYWFQQSAAQGFADAEHRLGKIYASGKDTPRDVQLATHWLKRAARHGVIEAQYELGKLGVTERGAQVLEAGRDSLKKTASQGFVKARELAEKLPPVPMPGGSSQPASNPAGTGLSNIKEAWQGYASVANSLDRAAAGSAVSLQN
jgi:TPR repeat protein